MRLNDNDVVPTLSFGETLQALADNEEAEARLADLYADGRRDSNAIATEHRKAGTALKRAEVNATLAVAEELRALRGLLAPGAHVARLRLAEYGVTL